MRIEANTRIAAPSARRADRAAAGGVGGFARSLASDAPAAAMELSGPSLVDGLLAFQEVEDSTTRKRRRALQRGSDLLDRLDELKLGLLGGELTPERIDELARLARSERTLTQDPELDAVLGEIELRAAVELAKLQRGSESSGKINGLTPDSRA